MRRAVATGLAATVLSLSACVDDGGLPQAPDDESAVVLGSLGPGRPPDGQVPEQVELVFSRPGESVRKVVARSGQYEVVLPAGTWDVRAADGQACTVGVVVHGGSRQRIDLLYPSDGCVSAAPPESLEEPASPPPG